MSRLLLFGVILHVLAQCQARLFTAMIKMEPLLETQKRIIDYLDFYIKDEENRLQKIKLHMNLFKLEHDKAMIDIPNYLGNPINAFTLVKRLTKDLELIENSIRIGTKYMGNITVNQGMKYPTMVDLTGAAQALARLQDTYRLSVRELSEGILNGVVYSENKEHHIEVSTPMTSGDCYELGRALYNHKDVKNALAWMMEAYRKFQEDDHKEMLPFTELEIVEQIELSQYLVGDLKSALKWTYKLLKLDPLHTRALSNIPHFKNLIKEEEATKKKLRRGDVGNPRQDFSVEQTPDTGTVGPWKYSFERGSINYEALCRGEMDVAAEISKRFKCWYSSENHPFLKYAPFKVEQMYITPDIFIFHDVLSDDEIELLLKLSKNKKFAPTYDPDPWTGEKHLVDFRISQSAWFKDVEVPEIARISQRITDMTGLDMRSAEELQLANYGIGGYYAPHYDFARAGEEGFENFEGNRIATVLFYMSDVAQGGATVFTELGLSLFPIKGAAAFWMNLHPSGEGDMATRHAACPVLRGTKWVCNKWIHQGGQELLKPCTLEYQKEGIHRKLPRPVYKWAR